MLNILCCFIGDWLVMVMFFVIRASYFIFNTLLVNVNGVELKYTKI